MIILDKVTKYYKTRVGKKYILKNVSMVIPEGVNVGILGVNGVGKSTFLRMLGGIDFPNSGKVISNKTFSWPLGFSGGFQGSMTGKQNVKFVARIFGKSDKEIKKIIDFVRDFSELGEYFDMPIKTYSSGMKSRLSFSLSLAFDFDYLLIDETLSVGDTRFKEKSKEALMKKIEKSNVLMVSHSMSDLKKICDLGIVLHDSNIELYDSIDKAINRYQEINLLYGINSFNEIKEMFFKDREKFEFLVKEAFFIENENNYILIFFLKLKNKVIVFEMDEEFFCNLNPGIKETCTELVLKMGEGNSKQLENKIVRYFVGFLKRFNVNVFLTLQNKKFFLLNNKEFLFSLMKEKGINFLSEVEKNNILNLVEGMERL